MDLKRVVIVEDDYHMVGLISHTLRRDQRFHMTAIASSARNAVDVVRAEQPDLVVLDHYLDGEVMGLETAVVLKTVAPEAKVIMFTTQDLGLEAYLEPEIDAYLQKDQLVHLLALAQRLLGITPSTSG